MNDENIGKIILAIILLLFLVGNICMLIDLFKKPKTIYKNKPSRQINKYESDDLIINDQLFN